MTNGLAFTVIGQPVAKQRPRLAPRRVGKRTITILATPPATVEYEALVGWSCRRAMNGAAPLTGPLAVTMRVRLTPPASSTARQRAAMLAGVVRPTGRPDLDNFVKAILDGCNGVAYRDDAQVCQLQARKLYAESPGVDVAIDPDEPGHTDFSDPLSRQF